MRKLVHVGISIIQFFWLKIVVNIQIQFYVMSCPSSSILFKKWQFYMIIIIFIIAADFAQGIGLEVGGTPSNEPWQCQILPCWWSHIGPTRSWITVKTSNSGRKIPLRGGELRLLLVECFWVRWQSLTAFCSLDTVRMVWKISHQTHLVVWLIAIKLRMSISSVITRKCGHGNLKIQFNIVPPGHLTILGEQFVGLILQKLSSNNQSQRQGETGLRSNQN